VELARPDTPEPGTGEVPFILVDKVKYSDSAPWPASADGSGAVLRRINPAAYGNDPVNWMAVPVTRPSIAMQPQSLTRTNGNSATFSVTAIGDSTLRYQWRRDGTNIVGATNASLTVNNVQQENGIYAFSFTVVVTDIVGSISSAPAILTVLVNPVITQHPQSVTVAVGANTTLTVTATGTTPFGYRWRRNGVTYLSREGISSLTLENVQTTNSGTWTVVVTNIANSTGVLSTNAYLTVVTPPTDQVVNIGSDATFNVSATGTTTPLPIRYLWQFNGITITAATNKSLIVSNAQPADQGTYAVLVYNAFGTPTLFSAELSLTGAPLILSDSMILPTGAFQARLQGNTNRNYVVEISTNLKDWSVLMTLFYTNGLMPFMDTSVTNAANRFYRARVAGQGGLKKLD
jgi:hypothetical protein